MPMCCRRVCAAHVHSPPESFRRQSRGTAFGKSTDVPASTETELWQMPQGRHIQHFLQRTLKRENKFKVQKMLHLFCKGVPFDFLHILFLPFPHTDNWKLQKSSVSKSAPMEKVANNSFRLGEGGGCGVCKSYCLCLSCFYAVKKLTGTYLYCWAKGNSWFEAVKVFERPSLTHACPSWSAWSDAMSCYMEQSQLYSLPTWTLGFMGTVSDQFVEMSCPEGSNRNVSSRYRHEEGWTVLRWWED